MERIRPCERYNRSEQERRNPIWSVSALDKIKAALENSTAWKRYYFGETVNLMTRSGKVLDEDTLKRRITVGVPISVHYIGEGDNKVIDRVILDED